jgi:RNA polymerase sigma factor (sigma-70 family)
MSSAETITHWIGQLKAGDGDAAEKLWQRYFTQLVGLARTKLRGSRRRVADEEDVALSAFASFCRGAAEGRFPHLTDRHNLWALLIVITVHKACDQLRHERSRRQGGGKVRGESALLKAPRAGEGADSDEAGLAQVLGREPSPELAAEIAQQLRRLLDRLPDEELRAVALWKLENYSNAEVAAKLGCALSTVERRLRVIRTLWTDTQDEP